MPGKWDIFSFAFLSLWVNSIERLRRAVRYVVLRGFLVLILQADSPEQVLPSNWM